jgi:hypothetical protein
MKERRRTNRQNTTETTVIYIYIYMRKTEIAYEKERAQWYE